MTMDTDAFLACCLRNCVEKPNVDFDKVAEESGYSKGGATNKFRSIMKALEAGDAGGEKSDSKPKSAGKAKGKAAKATPSKPATKRKAAIIKAASSSDSDEEAGDVKMTDAKADADSSDSDAEASPVKKQKTKATAAKKTKQQPSPADSSDEEDEEAPPAKKTIKGTAKKVTAKEKPASKPRGRPAAKGKKPAAAVEIELSDSEADDEDKKATEPKTSTVAKGRGKGAKAKKDAEAEQDDEADSDTTKGMANSRATRGKKAKEQKDSDSDSDDETAPAAKPTKAATHAKKPSVSKTGAKVQVNVPARSNTLMSNNGSQSSITSAEDEAGKVAKVGQEIIEVGDVEDSIEISGGDGEKKDTIDGENEI